MRTHLPFLPFLLLPALVVAACANSITSPDEEKAKAAADGGDPNNPINPSGDDTNAPPHALATLTLGEQHAAIDGLSAPVISAVFIPDSKLAKSCTRKIGTCEATQIPKCMTGTTPGCAGGEACTFDDICQPKCVKTCTRACSAGEECFFNPSASDGSGMDCRKTTRFDAGAIAFAGTTESISLFPPYTTRPTGNGAPFLPGTELRVIATGAKEAGFEKFDEKFKATTFIETNPSLRKLSKSVVFGGGTIPLGWDPGADVVVISLSGPGGTVTCKVDDKAGKYEVSRSAVEAAMGESTTTTGTLSLMVARERKEVRKDKKTVGSLPGQTVPSVGWLELVTTSGETATFASCGSGTTICGEQCVNTTSDSKNCGQCGKLCAAGLVCSASVCR